MTVRGLLAADDRGRWADHEFPGRARRVVELDEHVTDAMRTALVSASDDLNRPLLAAVRLDASAGAVVATDSYRMTVVEPESPVPLSLTVPAWVVEWLPPVVELRQAAGGVWWWDEPSVGRLGFRQVDPDSNGAPYPDWAALMDRFGPDGEGTPRGPLFGHHVARAIDAFPEKPSRRWGDNKPTPLIVLPWCKPIYSFNPRGWYSPEWSREVESPAVVNPLFLADLLPDGDAAEMVTNGPLAPVMLLRPGRWDLLMPVRLA